jgi:hypothetical protein
VPRRLLFLESFLGNFLFSLCMLWGVSLTSAVSAGVILAAIPATVALLSRAFLREPISGRTWTAIACAALGIGLLGLAKPAHEGAAHALWIAEAGAAGDVLDSAALPQRRPRRLRAQALDRLGRRNARFHCVGAGKIPRAHRNTRRQLLDREVVRQMFAYPSIELREARGGRIER